ncbi:hypothetical protein [Deinococcus apachensis]|uniref:hypothetical protein n=1 Tax=Deinococcus apachensis TaxID=309886 RepID=UPI0012F9FF2B|nr:hypothetical protein [Deinococcus apachensis]
MSRSHWVAGLGLAVVLSACQQASVPSMAVNPTNGGLTAQHKQFCVRTQGYYKNHSFSLANVPFFNTGYTYQSFLSVAPRGDAYIILAHQYIAARANGLDASANETTDIPEVRDAFLKADAYFKGTLTATREQLLAWATILDRFNNGYYAAYTLPSGQVLYYPHCD